MNDDSKNFQNWPLRGKYPYSEFFWSVFSLIRTEYGEMLVSLRKMLLKTDILSKNNFFLSESTKIDHAMVCLNNASFVHTNFAMHLEMCLDEQTNFI